MRQNGTKRELKAEFKHTSKGGSMQMVSRVHPNSGAGGDKANSKNRRRSAAASSAREARYRNG